jgi:hypothetical protein
MEVAADTAPIASSQRAHRSSVSNGSRLFAVKGLDGRTGTARRFRDLVEGITNDLGGVEILSEITRQQIRRFSMLSVMCEAVEADAVRDLPTDLTNYSTLCNAQRRLAETLGLERRARDVTDDIDEVLARVAKRRGNASG